MGGIAVPPGLSPSTCSLPLAGLGLPRRIGARRRQPGPGAVCFCRPRARMRAFRPARGCPCAAAGNGPRRPEPHQVGTANCGTIASGHHPPYACMWRTPPIKHVQQPPGPPRQRARGVPRPVLPAAVSATTARPAPHPTKVHFGPSH